MSVRNKCGGTQRTRTKADVSLLSLPCTKLIVFTASVHAVCKSERRRKEGGRSDLDELTFDGIEIAERPARLHEEVEVLFEVAPKVHLTKEAAEELRDVAALVGKGERVDGVMYVLGHGEHRVARHLL